MPQTARERNIKARRKRRALLDRAKQVPCADCGGMFPPYVMDFDHRDPSTKEFNVGSYMVSIARLTREIAKCDVVCANCHRERTWGDATI